jgi:hypothetical protein
VKKISTARGSGGRKGIGAGAAGDEEDDRPNDKKTCEFSATEVLDLEALKELLDEIEEEGKKGEGLQSNTVDRVKMFKAFEKYLPQLIEHSEVTLKLEKDGSELRIKLCQPEETECTLSINGDHLKFLQDMYKNGEVHEFNSEEGSVMRCNRRSCRYCPLMEPGQKPFAGDTTVNCQTSDVVYGIFCLPCNRMVYVGQTKNKLSKRMYPHIKGVNRSTSGSVLSDHARNLHGSSLFQDIFNIGVQVQATSELAVECQSPKRKWEVYWQWFHRTRVGQGGCNRR